MIKIHQHVLELAKETLVEEYAKGNDYFTNKIRNDTDALLKKLFIDPRPFQDAKQNNATKFNELTNRNEEGWLTYIFEKMESYFDYLAENHWSQLNTQITENLEALLQEKYKELALKTSNNENDNALCNQVNFLHYLKKDDNLKKLITAKPEALEEMAGDIFKIISKEHFVTTIEYPIPIKQKKHASASEENEDKVKIKIKKIKEALESTTGSDFLNEITYDNDDQLQINHIQFLNRIKDDEYLMDFACKDPEIVENMQGKRFDVSENNEGKLIKIEKSTDFTNKLLSSVFNYDR